MPNIYETPTFNLKAVVQETGVKPDTLRAWERRYGLPQPGRTEGGHRLYSQRDVDIIKWLVARQEEGMRIKRAVELWRRLKTEGAGQRVARNSSFTQPRLYSLPRAREGQEGLHRTVWTPRTAPPTQVSTGDRLADMRQAWVSACLDFDEEKAEQVITRAFALYPPEVICLELLRGGIAQIGQDWYEGNATVQQEHFATSLAMRRVEALVVAAPSPTRPGRILVACPPEEEHSFGLVLLTFLLRREGWEVLYLGANVPVEKIETTMTATQPQLAILAAQQLHTAANLSQMAQLLQRANVPLAFGGGIFNRLPALRSHIPGHFLSPSLKTAPYSVEQLMVTPRPSPPSKSPSQMHQQTLAHYRDRLPFIEAHVWEALEPGADLHIDQARERLADVNQALARDIIAALTLGDISFLDASTFVWEGLCHDGQARLFVDYLDVYRQAVHAHLGDQGALITNWLAQRIDTGPARINGDQVI
jgi:DNA-binding transcriptional MerR regulator/methylmalonyl-CoA mutase cobalamin-binding subunit